MKHIAARRRAYRGKRSCALRRGHESEEAQFRLLQSLRILFEKPGPDLSECVGRRQSFGIPGLWAYAVETDAAQDAQRVSIAELGSVVQDSEAVAVHDVRLRSAVEQEFDDAVVVPVDRDEQRRAAKRRIGAVYFGMIQE